MVIFKNAVYAYIRQNTLLLTVLLVMFAAGVIFGSLGVVFLDASQFKEISYFVDRLFKEADAVNANSILSIVNSNLILIAIIWFLGLTIIGIPLVAAVVFTRGFALGFTSAFLVKMKGLQGTFAVIFALIPPNLFAIPLLLFASTNSIVFSLCLLRGSKKDVSVSKNFLAFTLTMIIIALASCVVGILQGMLSPLVVKAITYTYGR